MSKQESIPSNYIPKYFSFSSLLMEYRHRFLVQNTQKHKEVVSNVILVFYQCSCSVWREACSWFCCRDV